MVRLFALLAVATIGPVLAREQPRSWGPPQQLCELDDPAIDESSGIASSQLAGGVFYTHNDSGDTARFFRFDRSGHVTGTYVLKDVRAIDWEDMASAVVDGKPYLYLGDVGDNSERRESITVYRTPEPTAAGERTISDFQTYTLTYPDGPHNCEALFVTKRGDLWIVTKSAGGNTKVYVVEKPSRSGHYSLEHVADLATDTGGLGGKLVTGADVSPDGKNVVLRTYTAALEYRVPTDFRDWPRSTPLPVRLPIERQGEAVCYSRDGSHLLTTSEYAPCPVSVLELKGP